MTPEERELLIDTADCFLRYVVDDRLLKLHTESLRESLQKVMSDREKEAYRVNPMIAPAPETTREVEPTKVVLERLKNKLTLIHLPDYSAQARVVADIIKIVHKRIDEELEKL